MICTQCGQQNPDAAKFCGGCGESMNEETSTISNPSMESEISFQDPRMPTVKFKEAVRLGFMRYFDFRGRSTRGEYWWFTLFTSIGTFVTSILDTVIGTGGPGGGFIEGAFSLFTLIPSISVAVRRLHDINRTGWWLLIAFTLIGIIPLFIWAIQPGNQESNRYGEDPGQPFYEEGE
jgi:uncharacterized membrane protein YhaH (DUF805 family)